MWRDCTCVSLIYLGYEKPEANNRNGTYSCDSCGTVGCIDITAIGNSDVDTCLHPFGGCVAEMSEESHLYGSIVSL